MNQFTTLLLVLIALSLTFAMPLARGAKLPGTRPVLEAAEYPSIQAAIDAHDLVYHDGHLIVTAQTSHSLVVVKASENIYRRSR